MKLLKVKPNGESTLRMNDMKNPLEKDPNLKLDDLFEAYVEASVDNSRMKSKFISYEDYQQRRARVRIL